MTEFFFNRLAVVDLANSTVTWHELPEKARESGDLAHLSGTSNDDLVLSVGRLTGSLAPAACLLTARLGEECAFLTGHVGLALRHCALDALVLHGKANKTQAIILDEKTVSFVPMANDLEAPHTRSALWAKTREQKGRDVQGKVLVIGPEASSCKAQALLLDDGIAPKTNLIASWMASHGLIGLSFAGKAPYLSPIALDDSTRSLVSPTLITPNTLQDLLRFFGASASPKLTIGRSLACFACPSPCAFWLKAHSGFVAITSPEALAALLAKGANEERIADIFCLAERFGLDPLGLLELANEPNLPQDAASCAAKASPIPEKAMDATDTAAALLGICPIFLRRFPNALEALQNAATYSAPK